MRETKGTRREKSNTNAIWSKIKIGLISIMMKYSLFFCSVLLQSCVKSCLVLFCRCRAS